jgi:hypothetical protein
MGRKSKKMGNVSSGSEGWRWRLFIVVMLNYKNMVWLRECEDQCNNPSDKGETKEQIQDKAGGGLRAVPFESDDGWKKV